MISSSAGDISLTLHELHDMLLTPLQMAQEMVRGAVLPGDAVVDATLGNGYDALFLAGLVGDSGKVYGFDVQEAAVEASREMLLGAGVDAHCFELFCKGHQHLEESIEGDLAAVMFNLGYLPRTNKAVITTAETTLPALQQSLRKLKPSGVVTIMCYLGHEGGPPEADAVLQWAESLPRENYMVLRYGLLNAPKYPAFLLGIEKVASA